MKQGITFRWGENNGLGSRDIPELSFPVQIRFDKRVRIGVISDSKSKLIDDIINNLDSTEKGPQHE